MKEPFASHQVRQALEAVLEQLRTAEPDTALAEQFNRTERVVSYALLRLDSDLVSTVMLDQLVAPVGNLRSSVTNVLGMGRRYLAHLSTHTDALLVSLHPFPPPPQTAELAALTEQAAYFRQSTRDMLTSIRAEFDAARAATTEVLEAFSISDAERIEAVRAATTQVDELGLTVDQQKERITTALDDFSTRTASLMEQLQSSFQQAEQQRTATAADTTSDAVARFEALAETARDEFVSRASNAVAELETLRNRAKELVGVVTGTATAGYFKKVADDERSVADFWRWVAVAFAVVVVAVSGWVAVLAQREDALSVTRVVAKVLLSVSLGVIAGYAAKQSGNHRRAERRARHRELQLAAIEPFVEPLEPAERAAIRAGFAAHLFSGDVGDSDAGDHEVTLSGTSVEAVAAAVRQAAVR